MFLTSRTGKYKIFFMIAIMDVKKIYRSKKFTVTALDGVSFSLPDSGLVFVVGKSGSGKSTLLNLLGGLDEATSGEICIDGMNFSDMKDEKSFDGFRAQYLGFVFQDFHLIDKLTVAENVGFALELKGEANDAKIGEALAQVGLAGYEKRYPAEMSGGQKQRVAIARAIVKDPKLILADEPTGNLDSVTSEQILQHLKLLSKDRLVVVVSHSMENARQFADRIIELGDGKIVRDVTRTGSGDSLFEDGALLIGDGALSDGDIQRIDEAIKAGEVTAVKRASKFENTSELPAPYENDGEAVKSAKPKRLSFKRSASLSFKFLRKGGLFASVVVASFLIVLFVICMTLYSFDGSHIIKDAAVGDDYPLIFQQQSAELSAINIGNDKAFRVAEEAEQAFRDAGYEGNIYKLVNMGIPSRSGSSNLERAKLLVGMEMYKDVYATEGLGVLIVDEEYLHKYFGEFDVLSGELDADPYGMILTDYLADSILHFQPDMISKGSDPYAKLIATEHLHQRIKVNAVIETGYKQKYADLFEKYKQILEDGIVTSKERNEMTNSKYYVDFLKDAQSRLNFAYTVNPDYLQAVIDNPKPSKYFCRFLNSELEAEGKMINNEFKGYAICASTLAPSIPELHRGEAYVSIDFYNAMFGTNFTSADILNSFEQKSFTVCEYATDDFARQQLLYEKTFTVKGIFGQNEYMFISDEDFVEMRQYDVYPYALVLDEKDDIDAVMRAAERLNLMPNATLYSDLLMVSKVMKVYRDVFLAIALVLLVAGFLVLVGFAVKNVGGRTYEIGIMRALGASEGQMMGIFVLQTLFAGLLICAIEVAAQFALLTLTNSLLTASLAAFMHNGMTLLTYDPVISLLSLCAMAAITLLAVVFPLVKLSRIKPIEILRKKD